MQVESAEHFLVDHELIAYGAIPFIRIPLGAASSAAVLVIPIT
jgi:hypothetical protein